jgi:hypothetical protein
MILLYYVVALLSHDPGAGSSAVELVSAGPTSCVIEARAGEEEVFVFVGVPPQGRIRCSGGEVVDIVWIRRHRVARVAMNPCGQGKRRVRVAWDPPGGNLGLPEDTPFENVLRRHLVNYEVARNWVRQPGSEGWELKSQTSNCKILVNKNGIYRVCYEDIISVVPEIASIDPKTIKVTHCGFELPIVVRGEENGRFEPGDWFEFYGERKEGRLTYLDLYSDTNVYWVSFGGLYGARLVEERGIPGSGSVPDFYQSMIHFEKDSVHEFFKTYPDTIDPWFWAQFSGERTFSLDIPGAAHTGNCSLRIQARTYGDDGICKVYLNSNLLGEIRHTGEQGVPALFECSFSQNLLGDSNKISFQPSVCGLYLNFIEVTYSRLYQADEGMIEFSSPDIDTRKFEIAGFGEPGIRVWKTGTSLIVGGTIDYDDSSGTYTYAFQDTPETGVTYIAQDFVLKPLDIRRVETKLRSPSNRADYLIITNQSLYGCGLTYASWRETRGHECEVVRVEEIYDEFNFGLKDPVIIQDFLSYAFETWSIPPVHVLLLGDASYDHRDIFGFGEEIVPTRELHECHMVLIPSDNLHACVSGDDLVPDMFLARLPVKNASEFNNIIEKLRRYEDMPRSGEWRRECIFASMECDDRTIEATENIIRECVPEEFEVERVYHPYRSEPDLVDEINKGALSLSYIGHSGPAEWAGALLWRERIPSLMNVTRLPFISVFGCYNGLFDRPGDDFMGELFLKCPGGGMAYWGPSGPLSAGEEGIVEGPIDALFTCPINTPGSLAMEGILKCLEQRRHPRVILQQILLGDPSTIIHTPQPEIELAVFPPSVVAGDSATISGKAPSMINGNIILTVYTTDSTQFKKLRATVTNGKFESGFRLPDTADASDAKITGYAWDDTREFVGLTRFSIIKPSIHPIQVIPEVPTSRDSVLLRARVFDNIGISWVRCSWGLNPPPWSVIEMVSDTGGFFVTKSPIPPQLGGTTVSFRIEFENWSGEMFSACSSYKVLSLPDLRVRSAPELEGISQVMIGVEIVNDGEEPTDSFDVAFYTIDLLSDTALLGKQRMALGGKEYASASVPWNLKWGKAYFIIDPDSVIAESDEGNNVSSIYNIPVTLFNVSKESGTDGWVSSLDSSFQCRIGVNSVQDSTVLAIKDTSAGCLARFRVEDVILSVPMEILMRPDSFYPGLSIYRWCPEYDRWLFIDSDTLTTTDKLGLFSLIDHEDEVAPVIELSIADGDTFYTPEKELWLKIESVISDESGIDIVDRKITITCEGDVLPDSLYSYPTEERSLSSLPLVLRKSFPLGNHRLCFIAYDFHGNRTEKEITIHIRNPFGAAEEYCWGNYPNPVRGDRTRFYFEFTDVPDEFRMQLFTVSGRLLRTFGTEVSLAKKIEFYWDLQVGGRPCANGVYLYKVFARKGEDTVMTILKLAILR